MDSSTKEPVAVIGMACRFPGDGDSVEKFWDMICSGRSARSEVPANRFNGDGFYDPDPDRLDTMVTKHAYFIQQDPATFDASFFNITPAEASCMDPQQRGLLETTYQAFENAGISIEDISGSRTSVHVASPSRDYESLFMKDPDLQTKYQATGQGTAIMANRLSYFYNLKGPSMVVDTACSSSLYGVHLACESLRRGEVDMAVVAGCNLIISPDALMMPLSHAGFLSPDGRCYTFDSRANGYARGEGYGVVILSRLNDAVARNDTVRAVIRANAANQDGRTPSITQPGMDSQRALIRECYRSFDLDMKLTKFVEAHGTGTIVGDRIETNAIGEAFARDQSAGQSLVLGAVKPNIGHLEGASGLASLIKVVLMVERGILPPLYDFQHLNPEIPADKYAFEFPTGISKWTSGQVRRASINSFGYGGSNAHIVVDDASRYVPHVNGSANSQAATQQLLLISAADEDGIQRQATAFDEYLTSHKDASDNILTDFAYTLSEKRSRHRWRSYTIVSPLKSFSVQDMSKPVKSGRTTDFAFLFTGQGVQWATMGVDLIAYSTFGESIRAAGAFFRSIGASWSLEDELRAPDGKSRIHEPQLSQPICTALQVGLVDLLRSWSISPTSVAGHSSGEIAAAYCAGAISREAAWTIAYHRGVVSQRLADRTDRPTSSMMAVEMGEQDIVKFIEDFDLIESVTVACSNSPSNTTLSGLETSLDLLKSKLDEKGKFGRKLAVKVGYHSGMMKEVAPRYLAALQSLPTLSSAGTGSSITMYSSVTGQNISKTSLADPEYWISNLVSKVNFTGAITSLLESASDTLTFVEVGPHGALKRALQDTAKGINPSYSHEYFTVLSRGVSSYLSAMHLAGSLFLRGQRIDVRAVNNPEGTSRAKMLVDLPPYQFDQSKTYWDESRISRDFRLKAKRKNELLGSRTLNWNPSEPSWRNLIDPARQKWVKDHSIGGSTIYPASGFLIMAMEAARQLIDDDNHLQGFLLRDVRIMKPLIIGEKIQDNELQITLRPRKGSPRLYDFRIFIPDDHSWVEVCYGSISAELDKEQDKIWSKLLVGDDRRAYEAVANKCNQDIHPSQLYKNLAELSYEYGPAFQVLDSLSYNKNGEACARISLQEKTSVHVIHPTTLDGILQMTVVALTQGGFKSAASIMQTGIDEIWISSSLSGRSTDLKTCARVVSSGYRDIESNCLALDERLQPVVILNGGRGAAVDSFDSATEERRGLKRLCYEWTYAPVLSLMSPQEAHGYFEKAFAEDIDMYDADIVDRADQMSLYYMSLSLQSLKTSVKEQHLRRYFKWFESVVQSRGSQSKTPALGSVSDPLLQTVNKVGQSLPQLLSGSVTPLQLLFESELVVKLYDSLFWRSARKLAKVISVLAHETPQMRILEVGAGIGSATTEILRGLTFAPSDSEDHIHRFEEYVYTDVSTGFFEQARERFSEHVDKMSFRKLDISDDLQSQGFEDGTYDVIVASAVLHATADLEGSLKNVRRLLKPGGRLFCIEPCNNDRICLQFCFGILPGWWNGIESYRQDTPLADEHTWENVLQRSGFSGFELCFRDFPDPEHHTLSAFVSRAVDEVQVVMPQVVIVADEDHKDQQILAASLSKVIERADNKVLDNIKAADVHETTVIALQGLDSDFLSDMSQSKFEKLKIMSLNSKQIVWVSRAARDGDIPAHVLVDGLARCVCTEAGAEKFSVVHFEQMSSLHSITAKLQSLLNSKQGSLIKQETEYIERDGHLNVRRVSPATNINEAINSRLSSRNSEAVEGDEAPIKLHIKSPGLLNSLHFKQDVLPDLGDDDVEVKVHSSSLNFRDLLVALGQVSSDYLGSDLSGVVTRAGKKTSFTNGDQVFGLAKGSIASVVRVPMRYLYKIPGGMSFEIAACLLTVYGTAWYALVHIGRLQAGETVLIHAAGGGVGQAAVQIATYLGATIYATVGSAEKKKLLVEEYSISAERVFDSRKATFKEQILRLTGGVGVDVVLNSLSGELLQKSLECTAPFGRFLEIGKRDIAQNSSIGMFVLKQNVSFCVVDLAPVLDRGDLIQRIMTDFVRAFEEHPEIFQGHKPMQLFDASNVEQAFRALQQAPAGKIVIRMDSQDTQLQVQRRSAECSFDPAGAYVIIGGFGGLGRSIIRWMIEHGARKFAVLSRNGSSEKKRVKQLLEEAAEAGVVIHAPRCDVAVQDQLRDALNKTVQMLGPIKGCIHGGMVLDNDLFENMSLAKFNAGMKAKLKGSWNLHQLLPKDLDFFILLSSLAGVIGGPGQANYAAGNAFQDALATMRNRVGFKAVTLDLGPVLHAGYVAENIETVRLHNLSGYTGIHEARFFAMMDVLCRVENQHQGQLIVGVDTPASLKKRGFTTLMSWMEKPIFRLLHVIDSGRAADTIKGTESIDYLKLVKSAASLEEASAVIAGGLTKKLASVLAVEEDDVELDRAPYLMGVDSLIAVDLRHWFATELGVDVPVVKILEKWTVLDLCNHVVQSVAK